MSKYQRIGIAGAGLVGRLAAWVLSHYGHRVSVFDPAASPQPSFPTDTDTQIHLKAAGFTAAGMLSPLAELDNSEPAIASLGWQSIPLWASITAQLPLQPHFSALGSWLVAHQTDIGSAERVLQRMTKAAQTPEWAHLAQGCALQKIPMDQLSLREPAIYGPAHAWFLPGEAQIDTVATMDALYAASPKVKWHWNTPIHNVRDDGVLVFHDSSQLGFDSVIDARGLGSRPQLPLRGVRGELVWLHAPAHGLTRPVRLLHPRHRVYLVPRKPDLLLVGASEIESEDTSAVSLRSAVELMAAAHSVMPGLAEARIIRLDNNLRPALPDNAPHLSWKGCRLSLNGLFRHGWLLAPALLDAGLRQSGLVPNGLQQTVQT